MESEPPLSLILPGSTIPVRLDGRVIRAHPIGRLGGLYGSSEQALQTAQTLELGIYSLNDREYRAQLPTSQVGGETKFDGGFNLG